MVSIFPHWYDSHHNDTIPHLHALFIHLNINEVLASNTATHDDMHVYMDTNIVEGTLHAVKSAYLCLHYTHTPNDVTLSDFSLQCHTIGSLLDSVVSWLARMTPALEEVSWEWVRQDEHMRLMAAFFTVLSHPSHYCTQDTSAWIWRTQSDTPLVHRMVVNWEVYHALFIAQEKEWDVPSYAISQIAALQIDLQLAYTAQGVDNNVLDFIAQCTSLQSEVSPSHISIEWDIARAQKEAHYIFVKGELAKRGFFPYQYWHFAKKKMQSNYLRAIYAMHPYLGMHVGDVSETAISWLIGRLKGTQECRGYMGTMPSHLYNVMTHIEWDPFSIEDELEMRMMQAAQTEVLLIPKHVVDYYHHAHKEEMGDLTHILSKQHYLRYDGIPNTLPTFLTDESKWYIESQYSKRGDMEVWVHATPNT